MIVFEEKNYWVEYELGEKKIRNILGVKEKGWKVEFWKRNEKVGYRVGKGLFVRGKGEESEEING